jgi:hypothetical protein
VGILQDGLAEKSTESMPAPKISLKQFPQKRPWVGWIPMPPKRAKSCRVFSLEGRLSLVFSYYNVLDRHSLKLARVAAVNSGFVSQGLLIQLRSHHPSGCLLSELLQVVEGHYVVRAAVAVDGADLATAMAAAPTIEQAEDQARARVMAVLGLTPLNLPDAKSATPAARIPDMAVDVVPAPAVVLPVAAPEVLPELPIVPPPERVEDDEAGDSVASGSKSTKSKAKSTKAKAAKLEAEPEPLMVEITGGDDAPDAAPEEMEIEYEFTIEGDATDGPVDEPEAAPMVAPTIDLSDAIAQIGAEIERIGWTKKQGSGYLQEAYGKRTRAELTETELLSFLHYLKALPSKLQPALSDLPF